MDKQTRNRVSHSVVFCLLLFAPSSYAQERPSASLDRKNEIAKLRQFLRESQTQRNGANRIFATLERLAALDAIEALEDMMPLLTMKSDDQPELVPGIVDGLRPKFPSDLFPAMKSIARFGKCAVPLLIDAIETNETNSLVAQNAAYTIGMIYHPNRSSGAQRLRDAASKTSGIRAERLLRAAEQVEKGSWSGSYQ